MFVTPHLHILTAFFSKNFQKCKKIRHFSKKKETFSDFVPQKIVFTYLYAINLHQKKIKLHIFIEQNERYP